MFYPPVSQICQFVTTGVHEKEGSVTLACQHMGVLQPSVGTEHLTATSTESERAPQLVLDDDDEEEEDAKEVSSCSVT